MGNTQFFGEICGYIQYIRKIYSKYIQKRHLIQMLNFSSITQCSKYTRMSYPHDKSTRKRYSITKIYLFRIVDQVKI